MDSLGVEQRRYRMSGRILARRFARHGLFLVVLVVLAGIFTPSWVPGVLFGLACISLALLYHRGHFVAVHENGLDVGSYWIGRRVTWRQIERVHFHEHALRFLTLTTSPGVPVIYLPLEYEDLSAITDDIARWAGSEHPLVLGLRRATPPTRSSDLPA